MKGPMTPLQRIAMGLVVVVVDTLAVVHPYNDVVNSVVVARVPG